jgi:hydroxymethylpyrimidine pyrophosphatase-like HAD family hydrolase
VENYEDSPTYVVKEDLLLISKYEPDEYFNQVSVFLPSLDKASEVTEKLRTKYMSTLNPLQNGQCIDIVPIGVNKAQGLYRVMEFFGSDHESVIAVGDNINDADMIREFHSYSMKNGVEEIKALADGTVGDITEIFDIEL